MNTVTVKINGVEYNLKGKEHEEYLFEVAKYVDGKFKEILANNGKLSTTAVAVLSALNLADEYFKAELEIDELNKKKSSLEERHSTIKERVRELKTELDESTKNKNAEIDKLKDIIYTMKDKTKEVEDLYKTIEKLEATIVDDRKVHDNEIQQLKTLVEEKDCALDLLNKKNEEHKSNEEILSQNLNLKEKEIEKLIKSKEVVSEIELKSLKNEIFNINKEKETLKKNNKELKFKLQNSKYKLLDLEKKLLDVNFNLALEKKSKNPLLK